MTQFRLLMLQEHLGIPTLRLHVTARKSRTYPEDLTLDINNSAVTLVYTGATYGWIISGT